MGVGSCLPPMGVGSWPPTHGCGELAPHPWVWGVDGCGEWRVRPARLVVTLDLVQIFAKSVEHVAVGGAHALVRHRVRVRVEV
eukprot:259145-Prymnesium_polylepis.1